MVDLKSRKHDPDARLFLHVPTGRFRRLPLPVIRDHLVLGACDGLIVHEFTDRERPDMTGIRVLNPFTGDMLHFAVSLWESADELRTAVSGGPRSTLVVWRDYDWRWRTLLYADPTSDDFREEEKTGLSWVHSMVTFKGNIYYAGSDEGVFQFVAPAEQGDHEPVVIAKMLPDVDIYLEGDRPYARCFLVESAGELLVVRHWGQALKVFRVDVEHKLLEEVKSLGSRTLFLGGERCLSVDADIFPSVDADCVYMSNWVEMPEWRGRYTHVYNLRDGTMEILYTEPMLRANIHPRPSSPRANFCHQRGIFTRAYNHRLPPLSLTQVLLDYCNDNTCFYHFNDWW
jgi:hypothetical protein